MNKSYTFIEDQFRIIIENILEESNQYIYLKIRGALKEFLREVDLESLHNMVLKNEH